MTPGDKVGTDMVTLERYIVRTSSGARVRVRRVPGKPMAMLFRAAHGYASLLTSAEVAFARKRAKARGWKLTVTRNDLTVDRLPWVDGDTDCNADLLRALNRVGKRLGKVVFIRSGRRTMDEQRALYAQNMDPNTGRPKPGRPLTAVPNASAPHTRGIAADCGIDGRDIGDYPGAVAALKAEGVGLPVPSEDWHCSLGSSMAGASS